MKKLKREYIKKCPTVGCNNYLSYSHCKSPYDSFNSSLYDWRKCQECQEKEKPEIITNPPGRGWMKKKTCGVKYDPRKDPRKDWKNIKRLTHVVRG